MKNPQAEDMISDVSTLGGVFCCRYDADWTVVRADESLYRFLGYTRQEFHDLFHDRMSGVIHPDDMQPMYHTVARQLQHGNVIFNENRLVCKDGSVKWIWVSAELMHNPEGEDYFYCMFCDISDRIQTQQELVDNERRYDIIMQQTQDTVFEWELMTGDIYYSPNFEKKFGYTAPTREFPQSVLASDMVHDEDRAHLRSQLEALESGTPNVTFELRLRRKEGDYLWVRVSATSLPGQDGRPTRVLGIISDIQEQKQTMLAAEDLASRDALTKLYNHRSTELLIGSYLSSSNSRAALMVIDVDNFKDVNDTLGHIYGDAVLSDISFHLKKIFRGTDIIGRVGGDEFVVFLTDIQDDSVVIKKAERIMEIFHRSLRDRGVQYIISSSIGISLYPADGRSYQELFQKADTAMYYSKSNGKSRYTFYHGSLLSEASVPLQRDNDLDPTELAPKNLRDNIVEYLFRIFLENPDINKSIPILLDLLGNLFHLGRAYIYEDATEQERMNCTFEWCGPGTPSMRDAEQSVDRMDLPVQPDSGEAAHIFICADTGHVTDDRRRRWFESRGVKSSLQYPILEDDRLVALVGFEVCDVPRMPRAEERYTLALASEAICLALLRTRKQEQLQQQQELSASLLRQVNACIYGIEPETHRIVFVNDNTRTQSGVTPGDLCYRAIRGTDTPCPDCPLLELSGSRPNAVKELYHPGEGRWSETCAAMITWKGSRNIAIVSNHDITPYRADKVRMDFLIQNIPGGMIGCYLEEGAPLYFINPQMLQYLGYESESAFVTATGGSFLRCIYSEDHVTVKQELSRQIAEKGAFEIIFRLCRSDGSLFWVRNVGKVIETESGKPATIGLCLDVTVQMDLQNQLELYRAASMGGAFVVLVDEDFTLLYGNDIYYNVHEYTKESMAERLQNKCIRYIYPDDLSQVEQVIKDALENGKTSAQWEMRIITGAGNLKRVLVNGSFEYRDVNLVMNGFIIDITEPFALREQIARNEQRYRIALQQTNTNVWEFDLATHTITMAEDAELQHAYTGSVEGVPERLIEDGHIHPTSHADFRALYQALYDGAERAKADILTRTADRKGWWWERITYTNIFDQTGRPVRAVAVGEDVTRQKEAEIKYQQELQMRYALSEGLIATSRVNLTQDHVEMIQTESQSVDPLPPDMTYGQMFALGLQTIANPNDSNRYCTLFSKEALISAHQRGDQAISIEYRMKRLGGRLIWVSNTTRIVKDSVTGDLYAYGSIRDIDAQKALELSLLQRAGRDPLTGTYDRETSIRMMGDGLTLARQENRCPALLIFYVEQYSRLIKESGYEAAEEAVCHLSDLLHLNFGKEHVAGRFYGDELVVFLSDAPDHEAILAKVDSVAQAMETPNLFANILEPVSILSGLAWDDGDADFQALYSQAYAALETARTHKTDRSVIYTSQLHTALELAPTSSDIHEPDRLQIQAADLLLCCAQAFSHSLELDQATAPLLKELAACYGASRAYLVLTSEGSSSAVFYEWRRPGLPPKESLPTRFRYPERIRPEDLAYLRAQTLRRPSSRRQTQRPELTAALEAQGIGTTYALPLAVCGGRVLGYLGLDDPAENRDALKLLDAVGTLLASELHNRIMQHRQAYLDAHDDMTGLLNRSSYLDYRRSLHEDSLISLGVAAVDINGLKRLNTRYGNEFGDNLVRRTAQAMREAFSGGRIYRLAGDEFLAVCENLTQDAFQDQVEDLRKRMTEGAPASISVGCVWSDSDINLESMAVHADERMLVAKQTYYQGLDVKTKSHDPLLLKNLLDGIARHMYRMFLQPKASITTGKIVGAEALVRGWDPKLGIISPDKFVPALENGGIIRHIDLFIFEEVCRALHDWESRGLTPVPISLNFSRSTLLEESLAETMAEITRRYHVSPALIEIEITESLGEMELDSLAMIGRNIRQQGYHLSLDDFGAKYSNLAVLSTLELDVVKLDKMLVGDLLSNSSTRTVVRNFLTACRELGIRSIAEGVETQDQLRILKELNCDLAQGYYFNKPIPITDFEQLYLLP